MPDFSLPTDDVLALAQDEAWWARVAALYPPQPDNLINLEHGYFGAMARPVQRAYEDGIDLVNTRLSPYVRGEFTHTFVEALRIKLAALINADADEILLTRSASESMLVLIGQYHALQAGDAVMWSSLDYPAMRNGMRWLQQRRGVTPIELSLTLPIQPGDLLARYEQALRETPHLKLLLLSHVCPPNGQRVPVREIVAMARARGVDMLVDGAHALGQLPLDVRELGLDFAGFNLHKWLGAPLGTGFVYIRKNKLDRIEPYFGDRDYPPDDIRCRLHVGAPNIGGLLAVPAALDFHAALGGAAAKAARLAWLRTYWMSRAAALPGVRLLSPMDANDGSALVAFAVDGLTAQQLQHALMTRFGIFTVARTVGDIEVVRATVAVTTSSAQLDRFVDALATLAAQGTPSG